MSQKFVIVPDVHGEDFWKEAIALVATNYKVVFLEIILTAIISSHARRN